MPSEYTIILEFNPNKAGLCESIFFRAGGGQFEPPSYLRKN